MAESLEQLRAMSYDEYLQSRHWKQIRARVLDRDRHACRICNARGTWNPHTRRWDGLQVHHRSYGPRGQEEVSDLTTLCDECHELYSKRALVPAEPGVRVVDTIGRE